jgi:CRP-like cAMP-binding protein
MTVTRIYVPLNASMLRSLDRDRTLGDAPFLAHAVTPALRADAIGAGQDQWEYAALSDAVRSSAALLTAGESRRVVAAADVESEVVGSAGPGTSIDESAVFISEPVALNRIASFHVDGDNSSEDDELLWYDVTELPAILALL